MQGEVLNNLDVKRQRRPNLQKTAAATAKDPQKSREQALHEQHKAMIELE